MISLKTTSRPHKLSAIYKIDGVGVDLSRFYPRNGDEKERLRHELGYDTHDFIISNVAEINKNKNQIMLIKALPVLRQYIPNIKVLFIGKDNYPSVSELVHTLGMKNFVDFLGYRNDVDILAAISNIAFSASKREGLGINIVEAMACGTPVVCSKNRGHNSLIENNISGFLFSLNNIDDMTRCIIAIYKSNELAMKLSDAALEKVKQYALDVSIKKMADIYKQFITPNF
jgi:glycosyltransferase EpsD